MIWLVKSNLGHKSTEIRKRDLLLSQEIDNFVHIKWKYMGTILLEGMEFFSYHGCFKEEQVIGTKFIVDLAVSLDTTLAEKSDNLMETVNYVALYTLVKSEMAQKAYLIEHVGWRIMESLKTKFPHLHNISLKICKINPPIGGKMQQVCYTTTWSK